ncbi:hypothetical protein DL93DRAFT_2086719 [Clavulina sp. PMI_390]|nr:hypothetical protein DL93DRAFT_2086719 [Clavulina sp. PMI_390]
MPRLGPDDKKPSVAGRDVPASPPDSSGHRGPVGSTASSPSHHLSVDTGTNPALKRRSDSHGSHDAPRPADLPASRSSILNMGPVEDSDDEADADSGASHHGSYLHTHAYGHDHYNNPSTHQRSSPFHSPWSSQSNLSLVSTLTNIYYSIHTITRAFVRANAGLLLVFASGLFFSFMNLGAKFLATWSQNIPLLELIGIRMVITGVCCVSWMYWKKIPYPVLGPPGIRYLLVARGVTGFFGLSGMWLSLRWLSLSDATAITFLQPSFVSFAGFLLLKEAVSLREAFAGVFALSGVVLIARPKFLFGTPSGARLPADDVTPGERLLGVGVVLGGVAIGGLSIIVIRYIGTRAHALQTISYFSACCVVVAVVGSLITREPWVIPTDPMWALGLFGIGISGFIGQALLTMGLQLETASRGSIGLYIQIIYSVVLERIFLHHEPTVLSIIGTCIIMTSAIYIAVTKNSGQIAGGSTASITSAVEPLLPTSSPTSRTNLWAQRHRASPSGGGREYASLPTDVDMDAEELDDASSGKLTSVHSRGALPPLSTTTLGTNPTPGAGDNEDEGWSPLSPFTPKASARS